MNRTSLHWSLAIGACLGLATMKGGACSVPVFRYALDHWHADSYVLEMPAEAAREKDVAEFVRNLGDSSPMNLEVKLLPEAKGNQATLSFPSQPGAPGPVVWTGAMNGSAVAQVTNSPARAEISKRILGGESVVWVLVEKGAGEAVKAAVATVEKRLTYLEGVADLPTIDPNDPSSKLGPGPELKVKFSLLRVKHDDPAEQAFLKMLAGPKGDSKLTEATWLAAVFGRGRVLGAWPAEGFGKEQIDEVCLFLLGACSCQVKNLNPGWDLLNHTDWDQSLRTIAMARMQAAESQAPPASPASRAADTNSTGPVAEAPLQLVEIVTNTPMPDFEEVAAAEWTPPVAEPISVRQILFGLAALCTVGAGIMLMRSKKPSK